ncbi:MAG TPA: histidine kinase dimerization/phospho-acceptor domain-containing protein, partial [Spirochaetia bacterium]|nr:histidine kinase dimerization/phospho-acceptor domain-containing protein [Spirochaetia bacterium]
MKLARRVRDMKLSGKLTLFFTVLVLVQFFVSLAILTTIISRTNRDTLMARMTYTRQGVEGYLEETFRDLRVKGELIAGQKKTIEYTDFGLRTLLARELVVFRESLGIDTISVYTDPDYPFASTEKFAPTDPATREEVLQCFRGESRLFVAPNSARPGLVVLSPVRRADGIIGVLSLGLGLDEAFVSRIERISAAGIVFQFHDISLHGGSLTDAGVQRVLSAYRGTDGETGVMMAGGHIVGSVDLGAVGLPGGRILCLLDTSETARLIARYNLISLVSTVLILSLALVSGFVFFQRAFSRRFQLILHGITKISGGDFHPPFQLEWRDELGQLAQAFDEMCRRLLVRETELSQLREKLALSSKLAALGEMAAGVAHQIRNPLVVMKVSAEMLRDNFTVNDARERYQKLTSLMIDEADTLNLVVSNFLDFARPRKISRQPASISAIIDFCLDSLPVERFQGISVRRVVPEDLPE